jgi:protoporphyrinogen oxidase
MLHITIVGGGIAGLSAAIMLCEIPNIQINIYEKDKIEKKIKINQ